MKVSKNLGRSENNFVEHKNYFVGCSSIMNITVKSFDILVKSIS